MREFFLSLHPGVRILVIVILVVGILFVLNYQPAKVNDVSVEDIDDMTDERAAQIVYQPIEEKTMPPATQTASSSTAPVQPSAQPAQISGGFYSIQVASSKEAAGAKDLAEGLKKEGLAAEVVGQDIEGKGTWYRVYVGRFATKEQAAAQLPALRNKYKDSFIKLRNG